jgi:hypothetical protein
MGVKGQAAQLGNLATAFTKAGYTPPPSSDKKLRDLMAAAILKGKGLSHPSIEAFVVDLLDVGEPELVWDLFEEYQGIILRRLFNAVLTDMRAGKKTGKGGQKANETRGRFAALPEPIAAAETSKMANSDAVLSRAAATHRPPGGGVNGMQMIVQLSRRSWIRRMTVANKPVANMTRGDLDRAIIDHKRNHRFLELVRDAWPPHLEGGIVSDWISDDEGDRLYQRAKEMTDAV